MIGIDVVDGIVVVVNFVIYDVMGRAVVQYLSRCKLFLYGLQQVIVFKVGKQGYSGLSVQFCSE